MSGNSTPTFFPNLEDFGLETVGAATSAPVFSLIPADSTVVLGPAQLYLIDAGVDSLSPPQLHSVDYRDIFVYSIENITASGLNIIQHANHTQIYADELILDIDTIAPLGSGSNLLGSHRYEIVYLSPTSYSLSVDESHATVINPHTSLVTVSLPSGEAGTIYNFVAASGQIKIYSDTTRLFVGPSGWLSELAQNYTLPRGTTASFICDGINNWYNVRPAASHYFS